MRARAEVLVPAYVLQARPYSDTSLLLELFTLRDGRIGAVARGARAPRSRLRGVLQPFVPVLVGVQGRGELLTLTAAEADGAPVPLGGDRVFYGWYLNELLLKLLARDDPHPGLFPIYARTLARLPGEQAQDALRHFERHLLEEIGFGVLEGGDFAPEQRYAWSADQGLVPDPRGPVSGATLSALQDDQPLPGACAQEARRLLKAILALALAGRRLQTPLLLRRMRGVLGDNDVSST